MLRTSALTGTKNNLIGLIGSSYLNQEALNLCNVDDPIKILGILFTYDNHKTEELSFYQMLQSQRIACCFRGYLSVTEIPGKVFFFHLSEECNSNVFASEQIKYTYLLCK